MDINVITQVISTVGFPIACCCVMFWQNSNLQKTLTDITVTMQKLADDLDNIRQDIKRDKKV